jgi:hypothetical protein
VKLRNFFNATAAALGSTLNTFPPAFIDYRPSPFLRPFDLGKFDFGRFGFGPQDFGTRDFGTHGFGRHNPGTHDFGRH